MRRDIARVAMTLVCLLSARPALADVALLAFNSKESVQLLLDDATGFQPILLESTLVTEYGIAHKLGNSVHDICEDPSITAVAAIDFSGSKRVAGPVACTDDSPLETAKTTAATWEAALADWPTEVRSRDGIWMGAVLNRLYAETSSGHCLKDRALDSVMPSSHVAALNPNARELSQFALTLCETVDGEAVAPLAEIELLLAGVAEGLLDPLNALQNGRPAVARRVARLVVVNAFMAKRHLDYSFGSGSWTTTCRLTARGTTSQRRSLKPAVTVTCDAADASIRVHSSVSIANVGGTYLGEHRASSPPAEARGALFLLGASWQNIARLLITGRETSRYRLSGTSTQWKKLTNPAPMRLLQSPLHAEDGSTRRKIASAMRYVSTGAACLFWFEDEDAAPVPRQGNNATCAFAEQDASVGVTAYESSCSCADVLGQLRSGKWKLSTHTTTVSERTPTP